MSASMQALYTKRAAKIDRQHVKLELVFPYLLIDLGAVMFIASGEDRLGILRVNDIQNFNAWLCDMHGARSPKSASHLRSISFVLKAPKPCLSKVWASHLLSIEQPC